MAFMKFKKGDAADTIYMNGHIATMDEDFPFTEAMAVKDGHILALGPYEQLSEFEAETTDVYDLEEKYITPGLIEAEASPVLDAFFTDDIILHLFPDDSLETVLDDISFYVRHNSGKEAYFGFGFDAGLVAENEKGSLRSRLDEIVNDRPLLMLSSDGFAAMMNSAAENMIQRSADEDGMDAVTLPYALSCLELVDNGLIASLVNTKTDYLWEHGFTSIFESDAPENLCDEYIAKLMALAKDDKPQYRFLRSVRVASEIDLETVRAMMDEGKTYASASEDGLVDCSMLTLDVEKRSDGNLSLSKGYIDALFKLASEKNFSVRVKTAENSEVKKRVLPKDEIHARTVEAAEKIGRSEDLGSLEVGKYADFTVFDDDPFNSVSQAGILPEAVATVLGGVTAYDVEEMNAMYLFNGLTDSNFEL